MIRAVFATAALFAGAPTLAQDGPPKLSPVFSDDFSEDTRDGYRIDGEVSWQQTKLMLAEASSISREINGGAWATVAVTLEPLEPAERRAAEVRIRLDVDRAWDCFVRIRRGPGAQHQVALVAIREADEDGAEPTHHVIRTAEYHPADEGEMSVEYRHGLVSVTLPSQRILVGFVNKSEAAVVRRVAVHALGRECTVRRLAVSASNRSSRRFTEEEQRRLAGAESANVQLVTNYRRGNYAEAAEIGEEILRVRESVLGKQHPLCATSLNNLGVLYTEMGDYARVEPLHRRVLEIREVMLGPRHPDYANSLNNLAGFYEHIGAYSKAQPPFQQAIEISRSVFGDEHPAYANNLNNLAVLYDDMEDYARAAPLYREAARILRLSGAEWRTSYGATINNLAVLYDNVGDYAQAELLYRRSLDLKKEETGEQHPDYATSLQNLALLYETTGKLTQAESLYRQANEILSATVGEQHPTYAVSLTNLGGLYLQTGNRARAESCLERALAIREQVFGEQHPDYANSLYNLAGLYAETRQYARAAAHYERVLRILNATTGEEHFTYASTLSRQADLAARRGDYAKATRISGTALQIQRRQRNRNAAGHSERQQMRYQAKLRVFLDKHLTNTLAGPGADAAAVAADLWQWKGAVTARQQAYRTVASRPELAPLFSELQSVSQQLSAASGRIPLPPRKSAEQSEQDRYRHQRELWEQRVLQLTRELEDLEQQIATGCLEFRRTQEPLTTDIVRSMLPEKTVFIDFHEYIHTRHDSSETGESHSDARFLAILVRSDGVVALVNLGSARSIRDGILNFRRRLTGHAETRAAASGTKLRELVWLPLRKHLTGITTVIISPDTVLGTLPFGALPGETTGSYLLEKYRFASLPLAGMLRSLVGEPKRQGPEQSLLVLGDVDYDATLSAARVASDSDSLAVSFRRGAPRNDADGWDSLPGFEQELAVVRDKFLSGPGGLVTTLQKDEATEAEFVNQAPRHSVLHLATHGYFADPEFEAVGANPTESVQGPGPTRRSQLAASMTINQYLPGLLSGLVLAGANTPPVSGERNQDGILTASEIEALNLNGVDLVVLSACETGLGKAAGGEGLTGLQRAFHIAGVRSCIATLWEVDDRATQELMVRFYTNLWIRKQPKIDALRNAQLWMLRNRDKLVAMGGHEARGDVRERKPAAGEQDPAPRTSPYFWAAFTLSGDWR